MLTAALLLNLGLASARAAETIATIAPSQAKDFVGKKATVCGVVASAVYLEKGKDQPTLLNLDQAYPKQIFTVVVYGKDRKKFGRPEIDDLKKKLCATGTVTSFKDVPQIVVSDPKQVAVVEEKKPADTKPAQK